MKIEVDVASLEQLVRENERARAAISYAQEHPYAPCKDILPILGGDGEVIANAGATAQAEMPGDDF